MHSNDKVAVVIPTLREARCVPFVLARAVAALEVAGRPFEIRVVDDESGDGTEELVSAMAAEDPRIRLLVRRGERGLAGAILHGWRHTDAPILAAIDADLQHPPELLPRLVAAIVDGGCDLAVASRYAPDAARPGFSFLRRSVSEASTWITRPLQPRGLRVSDPLSGCFGVRRRCVENIAFRTTGFKLLLEILIRGRVRSVREVPYAFQPRAAGRSKAGLRVAWDYLQLVAQLYRDRLHSGRMAAAPGD